MTARSSPATAECWRPGTWASARFRSSGLGHLTPAQVRAYGIADNRLSELSGWDEVLLAAELEALDELDFDLDLTGFDGPERTDCWR